MFTFPDQGEGVSNLQSIVWQEEWEVLAEGISGKNCVLSGLAVTGGADMTPAVAKGAVLSNGTLFAIAAADVTVTAADATNPRLDLIVVTSAGALAVRAGTPAAFVEGVSAPKPPARTLNDVVIAMVYVPALDTAIATTQIIDKRVLRENGPICLLKQTTAKSQLNSTATVSIFNTAPTIPSGLFLAGRVIRVRAWGNVLHNSTTGMVVTVRILYGGTVIFQDAMLTYGTTADADRMPWSLDFDLIASGNAVQKMGGVWKNAGPTVTAPTTGIGDLAVDEHLGNSPIGSAEAGIAVDSDAGNRVLDVDFDMDAANANNGWTCQGITVELL